MSESGQEARPPETKRDKIEQFLSKNYNKGELALKRAIGLGAGDNVIPAAQPSTSDAPRPVEVGWHPVGGFAGEWFAEKTGLGKMITEKTNKYPDPTQHWAVIVGDYAHQLWMDENFDIIYTNARVDPKEWQTFRVGETRFNDDALRRAGEAVIQQIRTTRPGYNLITNNCQTYVTQLLDVIQTSHVKQFGTTQAVYDRLFGKGKVLDLFAEVQDPGHDGIAVAAVPAGEQELGVIGGSSGQHAVPYPNPGAMIHQEHAEMPQGSVSLAQQVMDDNTTQLNSEKTMQSRDLTPDEPEHKEGGWREKSSSFLKKFKK